MKKDKWYIQPRLIIDREIYKGRGRPKKSDYRVFPDLKRDMMKAPKMKVTMNGDDYKITYAIRVIPPDKAIIISEGSA